MKKEQSKMMERARVDLLLSEPFFASVLLGLRVTECGDEITQTFATDGDSLFVNPNCVAQLNQAEAKTVLAHAAARTACLHPYRQGHRDGKLFNVATDHEINWMLEECNEAAVKAGRPVPFVWPKAFPPLKDARFRGMCAEEIYAILEQEPKPPSDGSGDDEGDKPGMGDVLPAPGDESEVREKEARKKIEIVQAAETAKAQGKLPAGMARLVNDILNPKVPWQDALRQFVSARATDDYSWSRPNKRFMHTGFILPSLHSQRLGRIAVAIDTSGSIDAAALDRFLSELEAIAHECRPEKIVRIDCDAEVQLIAEYEPEDTIPREFKGGGGTSHEPVWAVLADIEPVIACLCFTDMETAFGEDPGIPVLWCSTGKDKTAPFGEVIEL